MPTAKDDTQGCVRWLIGLAVLAAVLAVLFRVVPAVDLQLARLFYSPGAGFALAGAPVWDAVLMSNKLASGLFVAVALILLAIGIVRRNRLWRQYWGLVIALYLLGPGLIVNGTLKPLIGRARPLQIAEFGGDGPFTAAWQLSGYCRVGCSFVSAETSVATALVLLLIVGIGWFAGRPAARWFRILLWPALALLGLTAIQRLGSGFHFLSDVIFAALIVVMLGTALACWMRPRARNADTQGPTR
ncbi:phosphatase PAP2 family protein [Gemmobacter nectariphilus]|uniref:phosphatase PAP2 family protein n=1 Tax=Gemmobacter nectariphilus TaxID=220343 RepID=UPI000A0601B2|nr:phosphatase PAP2 family protein [Gemmobacter nectariphilus]